MNISKKYFFAVLLAIGISAMFLVSDSYSFVNPLEFTDIMKQKSGYTTITVSGEGSTTMKHDAAILSTYVENPPVKLEEAIEIHEQSIGELSEKIETVLENFENTSISFINTNLDGNYHRYGGMPAAIDSYVAYMSFPIKTDVTEFEAISQRLIESGFIVDDIRISQVPIKTHLEEEEKKESINVDVVYGSAVPGCETSNSCYLPAEIIVDPGTTVTWINADQSAHTVTSGSPEQGPDEIFDSSLFFADEIFSHTFIGSGVYPYFCMVHPWMTGTVTVTGNEFLDFELVATIDVRLETEPDTLANTLDSYSESLNSLTEILDELGISGEIPQSSVNINPTYYGRGGIVVDSYAQYSRVMIKTPLEDLVAVHQVLSDIKVGVDRINMAYSDSSISEVRQQLTHEALDDARQSVIEIIEPMGLEIKGIKSIQVNPGPELEHRTMDYHGVIVSFDDWNHIADGNITVQVDVEFEVGE